MNCGLLLSGCGFSDGSEIHEAVFCMQSLERAGTKIIPLSLNQEQNTVMDHSSETVVEESRNIMVESARISRGNVLSLDDYDSSQLDMLLIPGGAGCITNLSNFAIRFQDMAVQEDVSRLILDCYQKKKPIGAVCIAPVLLAKVLGSFHPSMTVGDNLEVEECLEGLGAKTKKCPKGQYISDTDHHIFTTPAYMYGDSSMSDVSQGIDQMVQAMHRL